MEIGNREVGEGGITKVQMKTFGGERYVHHLDYKDDFMGVYSYKIVHFKHVQFIINYKL